MYKVYLKSFLGLSWCRHYYYYIEEPYNGVKYELHPGLKPFITPIDYHGKGRVEKMNYMCFACKSLLDDQLDKRFNILWRNCDILAGFGIQTILAWFVVALTMTSFIVPQNIVLSLFMALTFLANAHMPVRVLVCACPHVTVADAQVENYARKSVIFRI